MFGMNYNNLKERLKTKYQVVSNEEQLLNMLISMFNYDSLDVPKEFIEFFLLFNGKCAFWKNGDKLIVSECEFIGNIDEYSIGMDLCCTTLNGRQKIFKDWRNNDNVVVMYNNDTFTPDLNFSKFASYFAEVEKSLHHLVLNSRVSNMIKAKDEKERIVYTTALQSNELGRPSVVVSTDIFDETEKDPVVRLTDPTLSDELQYLSKYHEDLRRRLSNLYGMTTSGTEKIAQQSSKEIENGSSICWIIPLDRLRNRQKAIEELNTKFDMDASVCFSECWAVECNKWKREQQDNKQKQTSESEVLNTDEKHKTI